MSVLQFSQSLGILLLGLEQILVPLLIEFLVLFNMSLLTFLSLLSLVKDQLAEAPIIILLLKFGDTIFSHLGFDILALLLTGQTVIFKYSTN